MIMYTLLIDITFDIIKVLLLAYNRAYIPGCIKIASVTIFADELCCCKLWFLLEVRYTLALFLAVSPFF